MPRPFRILLVDDSRLVRTVVADMIEEIPGAEVAHQVTNGKECLDYLEKNTEQVDLIIMDVEMPELDGISTLKEFRRRKWSIPVIMLSVLTQHGALTTFRALDLGALDFVPKPSHESGLDFSDVKERLSFRITEMITQRDEEASGQVARAASESHARVETRSTVAPGEVERGRYRILVIGSSTGGPRALQTIFEALPSDFPLPILVVQHMPPLFTAAFADRLNDLAPLHTKEAKAGDRVEPGRVYVAPGDWHMILDPSDPSILNLHQESPRNSHRPSVDVTMESVVHYYGRQTAALIMTGMGRDGVDGMAQIRARGGLTFAQDEASSVVFGMNRRAIEAGAVEHVVALKNVVDVLSAYIA